MKTIGAFGLILLLYLILLIPTLSRPGIYWDEQVDLDISRSYRAGGGDWFQGSSFDASQTRLPMYGLALFVSLDGPGGLRAGRLASVLMGALTLLAVYLFGRREMGPPQALLASLVLATSPYFLSFARIALTESDIFVTCAVAWFLVSIAWLMQRPNLGRCLVSALALGAAIACKFSAVALLPLGALAIAWKNSAGAPRPAPARSDFQRLALTATFALLAGIAVTWCVLWRSQKAVPQAAVAGAWLALVAVWAAIALAQMRRSNERPGAIMGGLFVAAFAMATFMLFPPVHTTNPDILWELARRAVRAAPTRPAFLGEATAFYSGCILFKSSPLIGLGLLAAPIAAMRQWRSRPVVRVLLAALLLYGLCLLKMKIAQTFYLMPLLPVLALLAADQLLHLYRAHRGGAVVLAAAAFSLLAVDLARCYPDYNLNGYQYLGARYLAGRSTLGYRSIAQATTDGLQRALTWTQAHARAGETVVTYITAPHIVRAICPHPAFRLVDGLTGPPQVLAGADFVVIGINATIADDRGLPAPADGRIFLLPYDEDFLQERFRRVYSVRRAFGLRVASVWQRRDTEREPIP